MSVVALILLGSGLSLFKDGIGAFMDKLQVVGPHYGSITNPDSKLSEIILKFCSATL
jgi:hypothetical protein